MTSRETPFRARFRRASALNRLRPLHLQDNNLSGPIPPEIGNLTALRELQLSQNQLTGPMPTELGNMRELVRLSLPFNELEGEIPASLANLRNARIFDLGFNRLSGPFPLFPFELAGLQLEGLFLCGPETTVCAPDDPVLRVWLVSLHAHLYPCPAESEHTALPRVIIREDGNGVSLRLPYSRAEEVAVEVSDSMVLDASTSFFSDPDDHETYGRWLDLTPCSKQNPIGNRVWTSPHASCRSRDCPADAVPPTDGRADGGHSTGFTTCVRHATDIPRPNPRVPRRLTRIDRTVG